MADGVVVVLTAFACAADLLVCAPAPMPQTYFADMPSCRAAADTTPSSDDASGAIILTRCRFAADVKTPPPTRAALAFAPGEAAEQTGGQ